MLLQVEILEATKYNTYARIVERTMWSLTKPIAVPRAPMTLLSFIQNSDFVKLINPMVTLLCWSWNSRNVD
jgi:hypothetical protein